MKTKIAIDIPDDIARGLTLDELCPELANGASGKASAAQQLERRRQQLAEEQSHVDRLPAEIRAGGATAAQLEDALRRRQSAALLIAPAEDAWREATTAHERTEQVARDRLLQEARQRNAVLQAIARELSPTLERLRDAERALDEHVAKTLGPRAPELPAVDWPTSVRDTNLLAGWVLRATAER